MASSGSIVVELEYVRGFLSALQGLHWRNNAAGTFSGAGGATGTAAPGNVNAGNVNASVFGASHVVERMHATGRPGARAHCELHFTKDGLKVCVEDDSKAVQAVATLRVALFRSYEYRSIMEKTRVGVSLVRLLDALQPFATCAATGAPLRIRYPGADGALVLEMDETEPPLRLTAELRTMEASMGQVFQDFFDADAPAVEFAMNGALLKEAVDDLGWANAPVALTIHKNPARLALRSAGATGGEVEVLFDTIRGLDMKVGEETANELVFRYKHKYLAAAFSNVQASSYGGGQLRTKVLVDKEGIMRVVHLVSILDHYGGEMLQQQVADKTNHGVVIVRFCILPEDDDVVDAHDDDDDDAGV